MDNLIFANHRAEVLPPIYNPKEDKYFPPGETKSHKHYEAMRRALLCNFVPHLDTEIYLFMLWASGCKLNRAFNQRFISIGLMRTRTAIGRRLKIMKEAGLLDIRQRPKKRQTSTNLKEKSCRDSGKKIWGFFSYKETLNNARRYYRKEQEKKYYEVRKFSQQLIPDLK